MINNNKLIRTCGIILVSMATLVSSLFSVKRFNKLSSDAKQLDEIRNGICEERVILYKQMSENDKNFYKSREEMEGKILETDAVVSKIVQDGVVPDEVVRNKAVLEMLNSEIMVRDLKESFTNRIKYINLTIRELKVTRLVINKDIEIEYNLIKQNRNINTAFVYSLVSQFALPFASKEFPNNPVVKVLNSEVIQKSFILSALINIVRK